MVMVRVMVSINIKVSVNKIDFRQAWQENNGKFVPCSTKLVLFF